MQEHIDYGACLDGRCCSRHSVEKKNALLVVQFLDGQRQRRSPQSPEPAREDASPSPNPPANHNEDGKPLSFVSADVGGGAGELAVGSGAARAAVRKRTPLHFASERGELSLVDRWSHNEACACILPFSYSLAPPFGGSELPQP